MALAHCPAWLASYVRVTTAAVAFGVDCAAATPEVAPSMAGISAATATNRLIIRPVHLLGLTCPIGHKGTMPHGASQVVGTQKVLGTHHVARRGRAGGDDHAPALNHTSEDGCCH